MAASIWYWRFTSNDVPRDIYWPSQIATRQLSTPASYQPEICRLLELTLAAPNHTTGAACDQDRITSPVASGSSCFVEMGISSN